jgi:arylsulfatase
MMNITVTKMNNLSRREFLKLSCLTTGILAAGGCAKAIHSKSSRQKPNIVLIMADDMGFSDMGCYGGEIHTPNLDKLAANGLRFTQFYNSARCCPTRASLLTGLYPHQAGIGHMTNDYGHPGYRGNLSQNAVTIAEALKPAGYRTLMTGKWHITSQWKDETDKSNWPCQRGFDKFYGTLPGHGSLWDPAGLTLNNTPIKATGDYYYTEAITDYSIKWMTEAINEQQPFFLYVAYTAPHYPLHARQKYIDKYKETFTKGWDQLRQTRFEKMKKLGIVPSQTKLSPRDEQSPAWAEEPWKDWQAHRMAVYAAMIDQMDESVGKIIKTLESTGQLENTLILFLSDNGGSPEGHLQNTIERLGIPWNSSLIPKTTRDSKTVKPGDWPGEPLGDDTTYGSYGVKWANVSNTPFRNHKSWMHEGGIAAPLIAHWPNGIDAQNKLRHQLTHIVDIMPTCLDAAGANYPNTFNGHRIIPCQGQSLHNVFNNVALSPRTLCWEHEGNRAIRQGKWKLVSEFPGSWSGVRSYPNQGKWELYDIENDRTELKNLADQHPEIVKQMEHAWNVWAKQSMVLPWTQVTPETKIKTD